MLLVPHFGVRSDVSEIFETTKGKTMQWFSMVREMKRRGMGLDAAAREMQKLAAREAGVREDQMPAYAKISVRTTVMGMYHYLDRGG